MNEQMQEIVEKLYSDLTQAGWGFGEELSVGMLTDTISDRMYDSSEEFRGMPYEERRVMVMKIARKYIG